MAWREHAIRALPYSVFIFGGYTHSIQLTGCAQIICGKSKRPRRNQRLLTSKQTLHHSDFVLYFELGQDE